MIITEKNLIDSGCSKKLAPFLLPHFQEVCKKYEINTPIRFCTFISQLSHESGAFFYTQEIASGQAYEGRSDLGNHHKGDGVKFKGRGFIQITGRSNYQSLSNDLGIDLIAKPELLGAKNINLCTTDQMRLATLSAGWYWNKKRLNVLADKMNINLSINELNTLETFKLITKKINGGYNGLEDRKTRYEKIRTLINK